MKQIPFIAFICLLLHIFVACEPATDVKLHEADRLMTNSPDSSLCILRSMQSDYPDMNDKDKAFYGLLWFRFMSSKALDLSPKEMIDFSIDYYKLENEKEQLAYCYLYRGQMHKGKREYAGAIQDQFKALDYSQATNDDKLKARIYFELGQIAGYQGEGKKTLDYYQQALNHFKSAGEMNNVSKMYMTMGWVFLAIEDYDQAIKYSKKAIQTTKDPIVIGDVLNDIGYNYFFKNELDSAVYYIRQSLDYPYFKSNGASRYYKMADVFLSMDELDSAKIYVNKALSMPIDIYFEEESYRLLVNISLKENDTANLAKYMKKQQICQDSIKSLEAQPNINLLEQIHQSDVEKDKAKKQQLLLIVTIVTLIFLGGIYLFYLYKKHKKTQVEADTYRDELEKKHEILMADLADEIEQTRKRYADLRKTLNFEEREQLDKRIYIEVLRLESEDTFIEKMNKILNHLPEKLRRDFPNIIFKDILWCCLFMLKLSTADISLIMDYKQSSQYKFKQRLIKKLGFNNSKEFEQMLEEKINI
ncbi:MAG: hypothetical protein E6767_15850 [Dysgonomonas sp.]|nr:hypothetical protein [Dysgonomonas sp.]